MFPRNFSETSPELLRNFPETSPKLLGRKSSNSSFFCRSCLKHRREPREIDFCRFGLSTKASSRNLTLFSCFGPRWRLHADNRSVQPASSLSASRLQGRQPRQAASQPLPSPGWHLGPLFFLRLVLYTRCSGIAWFAALVLCWFGWGVMDEIKIINAT